MELYADILGDDASIEDYASLALHFDNDKNSFFAGKFYYKAGQYSKVRKADLEIINKNVVLEGIKVMIMI